jgi:hypothetical protein
MPKSSAGGRVRDLYRRRPIIAWGGMAALAGVVIAVIVILAVGGGSEPAHVAIKCTVYDSDASVSFTFAGKVTEKESKGGCVSLAQQFSSANSYWRTGMPRLPESEPELVCALEVPAKEKQSGTAYIESNPESFGSIGTRICGALAHAGWTETLAPTGSVWAHAWRAEQSRIVAAEEQEQAEREAEAAVRDEEERAINECDERAWAKEEAEDEAIEAETQERIKASSRNWEVELEIEEEGWAKEEEAQSRREAAEERCENAGEEVEPGVAEPEGGTEYR